MRAYTHKGLATQTASQHNIFDSEVLTNCSCAPGGVRTSGHWILSPTLFQLSHLVTPFSWRPSTAVFSVVFWQRYILYVKGSSIEGATNHTVVCKGHVVIQWFICGREQRFSKNWLECGSEDVFLQTCSTVLLITQLYAKDMLSFNDSSVVETKGFQRTG